MKTLKMTTHWEVDEIIALLDMIDGLRQALLTTYDTEIQRYYDQQARAYQNRYRENLDLFEDEYPVDF